MLTSAPDVWDVIAGEAEQESPLWGDALLPERERETEPVFSTLGEERYALGLETIYEGYLAHYGTPRLFAPPDDDTALLLGDYLYAHGVVRVAEVGTVEAVADLAELISICAQVRADGRAGDGEAWAASAALLGRGELAGARDALRTADDPRPLVTLAESAVGAAAVEQALAAHRRRLR